MDENREVYFIHIYLSLKIFPILKLYPEKLNNTIISEIDVD